MIPTKEAGTISFSILLILFVHPFTVAQLSAQSRAGYFDVYVHELWKPFYSADTLRNTYRQTFIGKPACSEWQYREEKTGGNVLYVDTALLCLRVDTAQKLVSRRSLKTLSSTSLFQPLLADFESRLLGGGWVKTRLDESHTRYFHGKGTDGFLDSAGLTITYRHGKPACYESWFWAGTETEYKRCTVTGKAGETVCIRLPEYAGQYRLIDCPNGISRSFDVYHRLLGQTTEGLTLQALATDPAPVFALGDSLAGLNLVFIYTQACLPCHWFLNESAEVLAYLQANGIRFWAVLPADARPPKPGIPATFTVYRDAGSYLTSRLNITGYPLFLLLDRQGRIVDYTPGYRQNGGNELLQFIKKHSEEK